jgi:hypothetical protein
MKLPTIVTLPGWVQWRAAPCGIRKGKRLNAGMSHGKQTKREIN